MLVFAAPGCCHLLAGLLWTYSFAAVTRNEAILGVRLVFRLSSLSFSDLCRSSSRAERSPAELRRGPAETYVTAAAVRFLLFRNGS